MAMRAIGQRNAGTCNKIFGAQRQIRWCSRLRGSKMVAEEMGIACWSWWCGGARIVAPLRKGMWCVGKRAARCFHSRLRDAVIRSGSPPSLRVFVVLLEVMDVFAPVRLEGDLCSIKTIPRAQPRRSCVCVCEGAALKPKLSASRRRPLLAPWSLRAF
eukprot:g21043.t1